MEFTYHTIDIVVICGTFVICSLIKNVTKYLIESEKQINSSVETKKPKELPYSEPLQKSRDPSGETRVRKIGGGN